MIAEHLENTELSIIELFDEDGESMKFQLLDTIKMSGKTYVVLVGVDEEDEIADDADEQDVYIMALVNSGGEDVLELIEDDEELQRVFDEFRDYSQADFDFADEEDE